ncbi:MAG TPA: choice-of-anchor D domain-containing protein, partial [Solirubrobacteraceae bacterium]|nr:choice-of-anchor D domain-containing protein [Solirubrobacteraceae bacterium]
VPNPDPALIERWEPCEPDTGVTVIVDDQQLGPGKIYVGCAPGAQADGVDALQNAGFELEGTSDYGLAFICRIDGEPTSAETSCTSTPGHGAYWSYWRGKPGGSWGFSAVGAKSPQSASPVNSVEGWSFGGGGAPRIEPMDGSGPSAFTLPPPQQSSAIPAALAREWLAKALDETAKLAEEREVNNAAEHPDVEEVLPGALALARAGVEPAELKPITDWLARSCEVKHVLVEGCPLRELVNVKYPERVALAVLGVRALGQDPSSFAGMNLRGELEALVKSSGEVKGEGAQSKGVEVTAPTVLALARTATLSEKDLKTVERIIAEQNAATGSWGTTTAASTNAVEALVAAREQGAVVLGQGLLEKIDVALSGAGAYLESLQEAGGGVPEEPGGATASVKSTALGAVGLALSGEQAAAEGAAEWVSRYQVTAEYAGTGNPETGEQTPAEDVIGAFLPSEAALRTALVSGVGSSNAHGEYFEARAPTADALLALVSAGPYGPYAAAFKQQSLLFENRLAGSRSGSQIATLSNHDARPVTITAASVTGSDPGDFGLDSDGCVGRTLAPGESCAVSVSFDPTTTGVREALLEVALATTSQTIELPLSGTGTAEQPELPGPSLAPPEGATTTAFTGSQGVLGSRAASPVSVQTPRLDGLGSARGLVGVSWRILDPGVGLSSWAISSQTIGPGNAGYLARATGSASATSALLKLPPGAAYELRITFTDVLGRSSSTQIGKVLVPYDDRWSGLHYQGRWRHLKQAGAWLGTVSRAGGGAQVSATLGAGRPVFLMRATSAAAKVEIRAGSKREVLSVASGPSGASRVITAEQRSRPGATSLRVLEGTVDLDGVAVER